MRALDQKILRPTSSIHGCDPFVAAPSRQDSDRHRTLAWTLTYQPRGKTATIDIALFHLAYEADLGHARCTAAHLVRG